VTEPILTVTGPPVTASPLHKYDVEEAKNTIAVQFDWFQHAVMHLHRELAAVIVLAASNCCSTMY
jgi:hypothetical protein